MAFRSRQLSHTILEKKSLTYNGKDYEILPLFLALRDLYASLPFFDELKTCTEMLEKDPQDATALFQKAVLLYKARRFEAALQLIAQVLEIVPDDYRVWYNRGVILSEMGRLEEALDAYNRTIELEPSFEIAWDNKGVVLARLGRFEEALEDLRKSPFETSPNMLKPGQEKVQSFPPLAVKKKHLKLTFQPSKSDLIILKP